MNRSVTETFLVGVVVVNYQTPLLTIRCLEALESQKLSNRTLRVCVVENGSEDESISLIEQAIYDRNWSDWVYLLKCTDNRGYAVGNNRGVSSLLGSAELPNSSDKLEYLWLLNPDTVPAKNALASLLEATLDNERAIVGSLLTDPDGTPQESCFRYPTLLSELSEGLGLGLFDDLFRSQLKLSTITSPEWMAGASLLVPVEVYLSLQGLDEGYFLYYEEVDFFKRASRVGAVGVYAAKSKVIHDVGAASGFLTIESLNLAGLHIGLIHDVVTSFDIMAAYI